MARLDISGNNAGLARLSLKSSQSISEANHDIFQTIATMEAYLLTQGYTQATLDTMTKNDLIYACRQAMSLLP